VEKFEEIATAVEIKDVPPLQSIELMGLMDAIYVEQTA
jgi:hypothetical protein